MIPIYRAKTIKQDYNEWEECEQLKKINGVWYAVGFYDSRREIKRYLGDWETINLILIRKSTAISEINTAEVVDISTLSIHFPDMIDSQGNKIFASLSEDGKGGDIVNLDEGCGENFNAVTLYRYYEIHLKGGIDLLNRAKYLRCYPKKDIKVIGIQE